MQYSLAPNVPALQLLRQVQYASHQSVWQPRWTHQHNQANNADHCTSLESPPHILELEDIISFIQSSGTSQKPSISFFLQAGSPEIGTSDSVESSWTIIQKQKEHGLGRCYRGLSPYIGRRCDEIPAWSVSWHWYILPCNQVPEAQQM